jgi:hypothetical protein
MEIQAFIFNWKGQTHNAIALEQAVGRLARVIVINSDDSATGAHPDWINLDDSAYFSEQWNKLLDLVGPETDVVFHAQADIEFSDFQTLFARAEHAFSSYSVGVYEPKISRPVTDYDKLRLRRLEQDLFEVPVTDSTCWFIAAPLLRRFPRLDVGINRYGWGVGATVAAIARQNRQICSKDYSFHVYHPDRRGYSASVARRQRMNYINTLELDLAVDIVRVILDRQRLMRRRDLG